MAKNETIFVKKAGIKLMMSSEQGKIIDPTILDLFYDFRSNFFILKQYLC